MHRKTLRFVRPKRFTEIENNTTSFSPIVRNGWVIKFSVFNDTNILLFFVSRFTGQTILRYFAEENIAVEYINYVINQDPRLEIPHEA